MTPGLSIAAVVGAYLLGSVSFAYLLTLRMRGVNLRSVGSGNLGATNAGRVLGRRWAVVIYVLDFAKGFVPAALVRGCADDPAWPTTPPIPIALAVGLAAFVGHCYPVWHGFRGGKGVATGSGLIVALAPLTAVAVFVAFGIAAALTRIVSVGSVAAAVTLPLAQWALTHWGVITAGEPWTMFVFVLLSIWVLVRHRANMVRVVNGTEPRIGCPSAAAGGNSP